MHPERNEAAAEDDGVCGGSEAPAVAAAWWPRRAWSFLRALDRRRNDLWSLARLLHAAACCFCLVVLSSSMAMASASASSSSISEFIRLCVSLSVDLETPFVVAPMLKRSERERERANIYVRRHGRESYSISMDVVRCAR